MVRIEIQLSGRVQKQLVRAAKRLNRSPSDCIRQGIDLFLGQSDARVDDLRDIAGKFRPLPEPEEDSLDARVVRAIRASHR